MANYYEILGVNESASSDEIKRAYRTLASRHHPDKGGDTAKFQEIQLAYDTLSDPERRQQYDFQLHHPAGMQFQFNHSDFNGIDPFEHIRNIFGFTGEPFHRQSAQQRKNRSLRIGIGISLEETLQNCTKYVQINGNQNVKIDIPRGVRDGQTFKYAGLGDNTNPNWPPGDLLVDIHVIPHEKFQISNFDLITTVELDCLDALTGCETTITNLENSQLNFSIAPGTGPGTKYKLRGQGLAVPNSSVRGDLIAVVQLTVKKLDTDSIELVKQMKQQIYENKS